MVADEAEDAMYEIAEDLYDSLGSVDEVLDYLKKIRSFVFYQLL